MGTVKKDSNINDIISKVNRENNQSIDSILNKYGTGTQDSNPVNKPENRIISQALDNPDFQNKIAVSQANDYDFTKSGVGYDLINNSYEELRKKYGEDVANKRHQLIGGTIDKYTSDNTSRSNLDRANDAVLGVSTGAVNVVGGLAALGTGLLGQGSSYLTGSDFGLFGASQAISKGTEDLSKAIGNVQSFELQNTKKLEATRSQLDQEELNKQFGNPDGIFNKAAITKQINSFGRTISRTLDNSALVGDLTAQGIGSLGPSAKVAGAGAKAIGSLAGRVGNKALEKAGKAIGAATGVGISEASGTYAQTLASISKMKESDLIKNSDTYNKYIKSGLSPDKAKQKLAIDTSIKAFTYQLPVATVLGLLTHKFESAPLGSFKGSTIANTARSITAQGIEETGQSASSQIAQNIASKEADKRIKSLQNVGKQAALGTIGGIGQSGVFAAPTLTGHAITQAGKATIKGTKIGGKIALDVGKGIIQGATKASSTVNKTANTVAKGTIKTGKVAGKGALGVGQVIGGIAKEIGGQVAAPIVSEVKKNIAKQEKKAFKNRAKSLTKINEDIKQSFKPSEDTTPELLNAVVKPDTEASNAPDTFKKVVSEDNTVLENTINIVHVISDKRAKGQSLSDADKLFAANNIIKLQQGFNNSTPDEVGNEKIHLNARRILNSSIIKSIVQEAENIDLNQTIDPNEPNAVNSNNVQATVQVAKINPANVNPKLTRKILRSEASKDLSSEDIKLLESASKIAEAVNNHTKIKSIISSEKGNIGLYKTDIKDGTKTNTDTNTDVDVDVDEIQSKLDKTSRSIQISGLQDSKGKQLKSINDFASDIFKAKQSDNEVIKDKNGLEITAQDRLDQLSNLATHLSNKVQALNKSLVSGKREKYDSLYKGQKIVPANDRRASKPVQLHANSTNSVKFAKTTYNDAVVAAKVYNTLLDTFNDLEGNKIEIPSLNIDTKEINNVIKETSQNTSQNTSQSIGSENNKNTSNEVISKNDTVPNTDSTKNSKVKTDTPNKIDTSNNTSNNISKIDAVISRLKQVNNNTDSSNKVIKDYLDQFIPSNKNTQKANKSSLSDGNSSSGTTTPKDKNNSSTASKKASKGTSKTNQRGSRIKAKVSESNSELPYADSKSISSTDLKSKSISKSELGINEGKRSSTNNSGESSAINTVKNSSSKTDASKSSSDSGSTGLSGGTDVSSKSKSRLSEDLPFEPNVGLNDSVQSKFIGSKPKRSNNSSLDKAVADALDKPANTSGGVDLKLDLSSDRKRDTSEDIKSTVSQSDSQVPLGIINSPVLDKLYSVYKTKKGDTKYNTAQDVLKAIEPTKENKGYVDYVKYYFPEFKRRANDRLDYRTKISGKTKSIIKHLEDYLNGKSKTDPSSFKQYKTLLFVDPNTGTYSKDVLNVAIYTLLDHFSDANVHDPDALDYFTQSGNDYIVLNRKELDIGALQDITNVTERLANKILNNLNLEIDPDAPLVDSRGAIESLVKELLAVSEDIGLIKFQEVQIKYTKKKNNRGKNLITKRNVISFKPLIDIQKELSASEKGLLTEALKTEPNKLPSIGKKIEEVPTHVLRSDVPLSKNERKAIKNLQDIPFYLQEDIFKAFEDGGFNKIKYLFGYRDIDPDKVSSQLYASISGKNISVETDYNNLLALVQSIKEEAKVKGIKPSEVPIYFRYDITSVSRHQIRGISPQNNKIMRTILTPVNNAINLDNKQEMDNFWIAAGTALGIIKAENVNHKSVVDNIPEMIEERYGSFISTILYSLENNTTLKEGFYDSLNEEFKGDMEPEVLHALIAVAKHSLAEIKGDTKFDSALSFEVDGKTDGAANMLLNFFNGNLRKEDLEHFKRIGLFIGNEPTTLNDVYSNGLQDLYEVVTKKLDKKINNLFSSAYDNLYKNESKAINSSNDEKIIAVHRMLIAFGSYEIVKEGKKEVIKSTRNTIKNPMTQFVYGASAEGINKTIAPDLLNEIFKKLLDAPKNIKNKSELNKYFANTLGYNYFVEDFEALFRVDLNKELKKAKGNPAAIELENLIDFYFTVKDFITDPIRESIEEVFPKSIQEVSKALVNISSIQNDFVQEMYEIELEKTLDKRIKEGKAKTVVDLTENDHKEIINNIKEFSPIYIGENNTSDIGGIVRKRSKNIQYSSTVEGKLNTKSNVIQPDETGVKVLPYLTISNGDASMITRIFSADDAPNDVISIYDGIDIPTNKIQEYGPLINRAVHDNWLENGLEKPINAAIDFLVKIDSVNSKDINTEKYRNKLLEPLPILISAYKGHTAFKRVLKKLPKSIDHMGGSQKPYVRKYNKNTIEDITYKDINKLIDEERDAVIQEDDLIPSYENLPDKIFQEEDFTKVDYEELLRDLDKEGNTTGIKTLESIKKLIPKDIKIIKTSDNNIQSILDANYQDGGLLSSETDSNKINTGYYDYSNNIIYVSSHNPTTILHELVHAVSANKIFDHYNGTKVSKKNTVIVNRLETLMDEFLRIDPDKIVFNDNNKSEEVIKNFNHIKQIILKNKSDNTPEGKAIAVNEFVAYTLSDKYVGDKLSKVRTSLFLKIKRKVKNLMYKLLGKVPYDMFNHILFNTISLERGTEPNKSNKAGSNEDTIDTLDIDNPNESIDTVHNIDDASILHSDPVGSNTSNGRNGLNNNNGDVTEEFQKEYHPWIIKMREVLDDAFSLDGFPVNDPRKVSDYINHSQNVLDDLIKGGFVFNEYQTSVFLATHSAMFTETTLNPDASIPLNIVYEHILDNLKPEMLGDEISGKKRYDSLINLLDSIKENNQTNGTSIILSLVQSSKLFREAIDQLPPLPDNDLNIQGDTINDYLINASTKLMRNLINTVNTVDKNDKDSLAILDQLALDIVKQDNDKDFAYLRKLMGSLNKADKYLSDKLSSVTDKVFEVNQAIQDSPATPDIKFLGNVLQIASNYLDKDSAPYASRIIKDFTYMGKDISILLPIKEFVSEIVGSDHINKNVIALHDKVTYALDNVRQFYRKDLPKVFKSKFTSKVTDREWSNLHHVIGQTDLSILHDPKDIDKIVKYFRDEKHLDKSISNLENEVNNIFDPSVVNEVLDKSQQLADFMNNKSVGTNLLRNAYAISTIAGKIKGNKIEDGPLKEEQIIDKLVSLYALKGSKKSHKTTFYKLYRNDPKAVETLLTYLKGLNKEESRRMTEVSRINGYKGYIPTKGTDGIRFIIEEDSNADVLEERGFIRVGDYKGLKGISSNKLGYYLSNTKQDGEYSKGVLQIIQGSYKGVSVTTGYSMNGITSGAITDNLKAVERKLRNTKIRNQLDKLNEGLSPVFDSDGSIIGYERIIDRNLKNTHVGINNDLAEMIGSWVGRHLEEINAYKYNEELINELNKIYKNSPSDDKENLFINIADPDLKDKIYKDSWNLIPLETKNYIQEVFGEDRFMVRKDMVNSAIGYREASVVDFWTGKSRINKEIANTVKSGSKLILGTKAMKYLSSVEDITRTGVSTAKDLIVIRSLVIPFLNSQANIFQLIGRGVAPNDILKGIKTKFKELEKFNENKQKIIELEVERDTLKEKGEKGTQKFRILQNKIDSIKTQNRRMSIYPLIKAGLYKNISEGLTDIDVKLTSGNYGEWLETQMNKLPDSVGTIAKYGIISKSTAIYKGANKLVQYGDFLAKSIYYDYLLKNRKTLDGYPLETSEDIINKVNEEFVNFAILPGRTRSYLESIGATWFWAFKIRIMKIALSMARDNPLKSLMIATGLPNIDSPIQDNIVSSGIQGKLGYSMGWDMMFNSPHLNPWVNLMD